MQNNYFTLLTSWVRQMKVGKSYCLGITGGIGKTKPLWWITPYKYQEGYPSWLLL